MWLTHLWSSAGPSTISWVDLLKTRHLQNTQFLPTDQITDSLSPQSEHISVGIVWGYLETFSWFSAGEWSHYSFKPPCGWTPKKNIFHRQLLGFPSGIFSWLMDVNGIASGKRSQFAKITIFKFATSTISTIFYHGFPLPNCNSHFQRLPRNGHDEFRSPVESQTLAWESPERNRGFKMYSLENPWFLVHKFQFIPSIPILLIILIYC